MNSSAIINTPLKKILLFFLTLFLLLILIISINTIRFTSKQLNPVSEKNNFIIDTLAINHLSSSIRICSISYDEDSLTNYSLFDSLNTFLHSNYPLVFSTLNLQIINNYSLLFHWKGSTSNKKPVILYAHLDVVPADEGDSSQWQHPPFNGTIDSEFIYGRGAIDDKGSVIAILESVEKLISENFIPSRDIYIAFGHDEEAGGEQGAQKIAQELEKRGVKAEFLLDEGGLVAIDMVPFVKSPVALVFTSEKGYLTLELSVKSNGGHSSFPPMDPPIEILTAAIQKIHNHPFDKRMTESVSDFMDYVGPEMKLPFKALFANRWLFRSVIFNEYEKIPSANAMISTTAVTTIINGGTKENVIPSEVKAKINFRLLPGDSSAAILRKVKELIDDERISVSINDNAEESSKVSSVKSEGFKLLNVVISKIYPDAIVAPSLLIAQTDSRHFRNVTENIFRFIPIRMDDKILGSMHGTNEKIGIHDFMESIAFYRLLMEKI